MVGIARRNYCGCYYWDSHWGSTAGGPIFLLGSIWEDGLQRAVSEMCLVYKFSGERLINNIEAVYCSYLKWAKDGCCQFAFHKISRLLLIKGDVGDGFGDCAVAFHGDDNGVESLVFFIKPVDAGV